MSEIENKNPHYSNNWRLGFLRLPGVQFNCRSVNFPSISLTVSDRNTPVGKLFYGGKNLNYGEFAFEFNIDEDFENFTAVHKWMVGVSGSVDQKNYSELIKDPQLNLSGQEGHFIYSDATILTQKNSKNQNLEINIRDAFPTSLGSPRFEFGEGAVNTCTATFICNYFEIIKNKT